MTTLTATPNDDGASVTLTLTPTESIAGITRWNAGVGSPVRVQTGTFPRTTAVTIIDWEAPLGSIVIYTVTGASTPALTLPSKLPWLVAPLRPALSRSVDMVTDYGAARASLGTIHQVIDRPDPLVALGRLGTRSGSLAAWVPSHTAGRSLEDMIDRSGVVFFKQADHAGQDMYLVSTGTELKRDAEDPDGLAWILTIAYQEITRPTSPINEAVWTFGNVSTSFSSFANVTSNYSDFEGLSLNDQTGVI